MRIIDFCNIASEDITVTNAFAVNQTLWHKCKYSCIGNKTPWQTFLYIKDCKMKLTDKNGFTLDAEKNHILYMPTGSEYKVDFFEAKPDTLQSIVVHFNTFDKNGNPVNFSDKEMICLSNGISLLRDFEQLGNEFDKPAQNEMFVKSKIYSILNGITVAYNSKAVSEKFSLIESGIRKIETGELNQNIFEIAKQCNVSEAYFRKLFKEYSGKTPKEYLLDASVKMAKNYLCDSDISLKELSENLGFCDVYHFSKTFKNKTGITPSSWRKKYK